MKTWRSLKRTMGNLVLLGFCCLAIEQVSYCFWVSGYFVQLMISPVFWGSFSLVCFSLFWWFGQQSNIAFKSEGCAETTGDIQRPYDFMMDNPMSLANPNNMLPRNWGGWW